MNAIKNILKEELDRLIDEDIISAYHGSPHYEVIGKFKKGKTGYLGPGIYFTNNEEVARGYADKNAGFHSGKIYKVDIFMRNPLKVTTNNPTKEFLDIVYGTPNVYLKRKSKQEWETHLINSKDIKKFFNIGYDGVIWEFGGKIEYIIYEPKDIEILDSYSS